MPLLGKLLGSVLLSVGLGGGVGWLLVEGTFDLPPHAMLRVRVVAASGLAAGALLLAAAAIRWAGPLRRATGRDGTVAEPGKVAAALAGARLPPRVSAAALALGTAATGAAVALVGRAGVPSDLLAAGAALGVAGALLAALVAREATAWAVAAAVESLGPRADLGGSGAARGRVLRLALGLDTVAVVLLAAAGYAHHRADTLRAELSDVERGLAAAISLGADGPGLPRTTWIATGDPTLLIAPDGSPGEAAGGGMPPGRGAGPPGTERVDDPPGWVVRARLRGGSTLASWVPEERLRVRWQAFRRGFAPLALLVWAVGAALAFAASRAAASPLRGLGRAASRMASGDLTVDPPSPSRDDAGRLAEDFRRIAQGLRSIVAEVQAAGEGITLGAREAAAIGARIRTGGLERRSALEAARSAVEAAEATVAQLSRGMGELTAQLHAAAAPVAEAVSALEGVRAKGAELARSARTAVDDVDALVGAGREAELGLAELLAATTRAGETLSAVRASLAALERASEESESSAGLVAEVAQKASGVMEETVHGIEAARAAVSDAHRRIAALGRRSDDVEQVVDFIGEVAGRTNLLSLNASIIASQAGEHGKAFAVVADQIRELAAQIARSTRSIGDIIHAVREEIAATAALVDRGDLLAGEGVQLARNALDALSSIQRYAQQDRAAAGAVGAAVGAHGAASREVAGAMDSVADGTRVVAAALQAMARSLGGAAAVSRNVDAAAGEVARILEERGASGGGHLDAMDRVDRTVGEVARMADAHLAATRRLRELLLRLADAAGRQETAVGEVAKLSERLGEGARVLSDSVGRFRI
jgi:methyl-accepting chemotaxis protein